MQFYLVHKMMLKNNYTPALPTNIKRISFLFRIPTNISGFISLIFPSFSSISFYPS